MASFEPGPIKRALLISAAVLAASACGNAEPASTRDGQADAGSSNAAAAAAMVEPARISDDALRAAVSDERVKSFYEARNWRPAWTEVTVPGLIAALDEAPRHGLDRAMFLQARGAPADPARREAELTKAALDYAEALAKGRTDPTRIRDVYTVPRPEVDAAAGLAQALEAGNVREWISALAPQDPAYRALSEAYLHYRRQAAQEQGSAITAGGTIRVDESDPRGPRIVEALRTNGYLSQQQGSAEANRYTAELADAVKKMQSDYGIAADGVVGPDTLEVLNTGSADRALQLAINLERRRWLEREAPPTRIDVNTAAATLDFWRNGSHADRRRVVVGQPGWETPQLGSPIFRLVANPTWTVPKSIEREEIAPKGQAYLRRNNMVRRDGWIVQLPGPDNALGQVKFDMRNDQAIYLHDTPAKSLFRQNERHRSHGCIRVEDALGFARILAEADGKLSRFEEAMATGEETFVDLDNNIPVRLVYHTAFVGPEGNVLFRNDAYGWDADVASALGLQAREQRAATPRHSDSDSDIGP